MSKCISANFVRGKESNGYFALVVGETPSKEYLTLFRELQIVYVTITDLLDRHVVQKDNEGNAISVEKTAYFVGAMAGTKAGFDALNAKRADLNLFFGDESCDIIDLTASRNLQATFLGWISRRMIAVASGLIVDGWATRQGLCVLRREHEETVERFAELESTLASFVTPRRVSKLNFPPSGLTLDFGRESKDGARVCKVRQVLPTSLHGLAVIEIHVAAPPRSESGTLKMELVFGSTNVPAQTWSLPAKMLRKGWVAVRLARALTSREQDASIVVSWNADNGRDVLGLTLSDPNPLREYCVVTDGGYRSNAPLALRVWGMVPGARVTASNASDPLDVADHGAAEEPLRFALAADELRDAQLLDSDLELGWKVVDFREDAMDVLVHPVNNKPTFAIVRNVGLLGVRSLSALVLVDHKDANAVEFGLAIVPHKPVHASAEGYIKTWVTADPQTFTDVVGSVDGMQSAQNDLILATRMKDGMASNCAWARFKRIEIGF